MNEKKVLCCCASRALVEGSWLVQSGRNTKRFKSSCWHLQTSMTKSMGVKSGSHFSPCCHKVDNVWGDRQRECMRGQDWWGVTVTSCLICKNPTMSKFLRSVSSFAYYWFQEKKTQTKTKQNTSTADWSFHVHLKEWKRDKSCQGKN